MCSGSIWTGEVWRDDTIAETRRKKDWAWYCGIEDYVPFVVPVPSKIDGNFIEQIARNHWSVGVRPLQEDLFKRILSLANCAAGHSPDDQVALPDLGTLDIREAAGDLLIPRKPSQGGGQSNEGGGSRYSRNAAPIGKRAEEIARKYILDNATGWVQSTSAGWPTRD
jgi:hypothetical protein